MSRVGVIIHNMPIFRLYCEKCKKEFEVLAKFEDTNNVDCPECNTKLQRLMSAPKSIIIR